MIQTGNKNTKTVGLGSVVEYFGGKLPVLVDGKAPVPTSTLREAGIEPIDKDSAAGKWLATMDDPIPIIGGGKESDMGAQTYSSEDVNKTAKVAQSPSGKQRPFERFLEARNRQQDVVRSVATDLQSGELERSLSIDYSRGSNNYDMQRRSYTFGQYHTDPTSATLNSPYTGRRGAGFGHYRHG